MKTKDIIVEELKKAGLNMAEEEAKLAFNALCDGIIPRLAMEADEAMIKSASALLLMALPTFKPVVLEAIDKIDGQVG